MLHESPIAAADMLSLAPQREQAVWFAETMTPELAAFLAGNPYSRTVRTGTGAIVLCCGAIEMRPHLAHAWSMLSVDAPPHMFGIIKRVRGFLDLLPHRRVEMNVRGGFAAGHKWARLLGFEREGIMRAYGADGEDHHLYARVRL